MKVYIVDDTSFIRIICRYHLTKAGHNICGEAFDGETALREILSMQPDCVIMDLALPGKSGAEVMMEVQEKFPQIRFIVLSALDKDFLLSKFPDVRFESYIRKPFEAIDLLSAVQNAELGMEKKKNA